MAARRRRAHRARQAAAGQDRGALCRRDRDPLRGGHETPRSRAVSVRTAAGPMDFSTTPEQDAFVETVRRFAAEHIAPFYQRREREGAFDRVTLREMGRLGFFGVELPERYGGLGLDCLTAGL